MSFQCYQAIGKSSLQLATLRTYMNRELQEVQAEIEASLIELCKHQHDTEPCSNDVCQQISSDSKLCQQPMSIEGAGQPRPGPVLKSHKQLPHPKMDILQRLGVADPMNNEELPAGTPHACEKVHDEQVVCARPGRKSRICDDVQFDEDHCEQSCPTLEGIVNIRSHRSAKKRHLQQSDTGNLTCSDEGRRIGGASSRSRFMESEDEQLVPPPNPGLTRDMTWVSTHTKMSSNISRATSRRSLDKQPVEKEFLAIWPVWADDEIGLRAPSPSKTQQAAQLAVRKGSFRTGDEIHGRGCLHMIVLRPSSPSRIFWDFLSVLALGYDVLLIPLHPFNLPETQFTTFMNVITTIFWSVDVFLSFITGFQADCFLEMRFEKIARRYLKTWFVLDILLVLMDYLLMFTYVAASSIDVLAFGRLGKALRIVRVLRIVRLLRMSKAVVLFNDLTDAIFSDAMLVALNILRLMIIIMLGAHYLACGWYAVGVQSIDPELNTWVKALQVVENSDASFGWFYTSSLHWSITQFTPASMEIVPQNVFERCYAVCVIVVAFVSFSSFVSSITSAMAHLRNLNLESTRQQEQVRRYITENRVSLDLGNRIQSFVRQSRRNADQMTRIHEDQIPVLSSLPDSLRMEIHGQVFVPILDTHPFFNQFNQVDHVGILHICHNTMTEQSVSCHQSLFTEADECSKMYFVLSGQLEYQHESDTQPSGCIEAGGYACEMALWVQWEHQGRLTASVSCEVVGLDSQLFRSIALKTDSFESCQKYAQGYAQHLHESWDDDEIRSDLWFSFDVALEFAQKAFEDVLAASNIRRGWWMKGVTMSRTSRDSPLVAASHMFQRSKSFLSWK